jgi:hypothetical protein
VQLVPQHCQAPPYCTADRGGDGNQEKSDANVEALDHVHWSYEMDPKDEVDQLLSPAGRH